jgi:cytochrome c biogenesis protein CcmG/thiol:disulfide interchange protein DsbE
MRQMLQCPVCGAYNIPGKPFCYACGQVLRFLCPYCGNVVFANYDTCPACNRKLQWDWKVPRQEMAAPQAPPVPPAPPQVPPPTRNRPLIIIAAASGIFVIALVIILVLSNQGTFSREPASSTDITAPVISDISIEVQSDTSAVVLWTTDEPASSQVQLCEVGSLCFPWIEPKKQLSREHSVTVKDLSPGTDYSVLVKSVDASGNETVSEKNTFTTSGEQTEQEPEPAEADIGKRAPDFTLESLDGETITLSTLQGRPVMLNFWQTTCSPCLAEFPHFQTVRTSWSEEDLAMLAVAYQQNTQVVADFIDREGYTFSVLLDSGLEVSDLYNVSDIPITFFIDAEGIIREIKIGRFSSVDEIESVLDSL